MLGILFSIWVVIWCFIIIKRYFRDIVYSWQEPVLKYPVLIFESDDWGAGPLSQITALSRIKEILARYSDKKGHHPVMTLGVVLSIPDSNKIIRTGYRSYFAKRLDHPDFLPIKTMMLNGLTQGVFDLHLHGMAHYWPDNLMRALQTDKKVQQWLNQGYLLTEELPSTLQSRWTNNKQLPTIPLNHNEVDRAVKEEVEEFKKQFGTKPTVVVPPTFIWDEFVEQSWRKCAINYLITPGQYYDHRDKRGKPSGNEEKIVNGQLSRTGLTYMVRNDYFEPGLGHTAEKAVKELDIKTHLAQPTLLEIHRFNFIQNEAITKNSLLELEKVITLALEKYPDIMFLSTQVLAEKYSSKNKYFIEKSYLIRLLVCMERLWINHTIKKWLYISGLFPIFILSHIVQQQLRSPDSINQK